MRRVLVLAVALLALIPAAPVVAGPKGAVVVSTAPRLFATRYVVVNEGDIATLHQLDPAFPHDVISEGRTPEGEPLFATRNVLSFGENALIERVDDLKAGDYPFTCSLHSDMFGMLLVRD